MHDNVLMVHKEDGMPDNTGLEWTKFIVTTLGGIIVFGGGLYQYISTSSHTARQPFLEKQTALCFQASEQAARLATTVDQDQWKNSWSEFWMLYWGPLAIVEDVSGQKESGQKESIYAKVAPSMIQFGTKIKTIGETPKTLPADGLTGLAINISKACQVLVTSWWATGVSSWFRQQQ
jgi:hypothetical protein